MKKEAKETKIHTQGFVVDNDKFIYDPELNKYSNVVLFPEKLAKAQEAIKKPGFKKLMESIDALKEKESK